MQIWATGDPSTADAIMSETVRNVDLLFEQETNGREEFKSMIHNVFKVAGHMSCLSTALPATSSQFALQDVLLISSLLTD